MSFWTEDKQADCKRLFEMGRTASEICAEIGAVSRNAVIGFCHRKGFYRSTELERAIRKQNAGKPRPRRMQGPATSAHAVKVARHRAIDAGHDVAPLPFVCQDVADIEPLHLSLDDLKHDSCRWPYGQGPFTFCGHAVLSAPYCAAHRAVAFTRHTGKAQTEEHKAKIALGRRKFYAAQRVVQ